ncbi:MAG: HAD family hydrolase [Actinomycetota bacterium]|nr:HAD family hydrolase [Actinomycetota bacterium]
MTLEAVLFDVDFTLVRPGPELGPEGYVRVARRHGLELDPARHDEARARALETLQRDPDLRHDEEIWIAFTERIVRGMGGNSDRARRIAVEIESAWERSENFDLYEDAMPVLDELRRHGLKLGLVSNGARDIEEFVAHHRLDVDAAVGSRSHGKVKPDPTIFLAALQRLGVAPGAAAMVGDSMEDDVQGARAVGVRAFLIDRADRYPDVEDRLPNLYALPAALGLTPSR